jgi:hypothetical protein
MTETYKARSIFAPNPWRHPIRAWRMRRMFRRLRNYRLTVTVSDVVGPETHRHIRQAEEEAFLFGRNTEDPGWQHDAS